MKIVYVAGPFTGPNHWVVAENVRNAERWGLELAKRGVWPLIPHANTHHFFGAVNEELAYAGTMELLARSDGAIFIPRWKKSFGSMKEYEFCIETKKRWLDVDGFSIECESHMSALDTWIRSLEGFRNP